MNEYPMEQRTVKAGDKEGENKWTNFAPLILFFFFFFLGKGERKKGKTTHREKVKEEAKRKKGNWLHCYNGLFVQCKQWSKCILRKTRSSSSPDWRLASLSFPFLIFPFCNRHLIYLTFIYFHRQICWHIHTFNTTQVQCNIMVSFCTP